MSAISSHDLTGTLRNTRKSRSYLLVAGLALAPFALLGALVAIGIARGGIEPYMVLAAWLLG